MPKLAAKTTLMMVLAGTLALVQVQPSWSADEESKPPFPVGHKISRFVQMITGMNAISAFVASKAATIALERKLGGEVKARIKSYSLTDLLAGKIRHLELTFKDAKVRGVQLGYLHVASKNPIWLSRKRQAGSSVNSPVLLTLDGCLSQKEISQALKDPQVTSTLSTMKLDIPGLGDQQLEILEPNVQIENGKVKIRATVVTKGAKRETGVPITISATPYVVEDGGKLCMKDMVVESSEIENPAEFAQFVTELFNPLVNFTRMDTGTRAFRVTDCKISDNKIDFNGKIFLAPKKSDAQLAQKANVTR